MSYTDALGRTAEGGELTFHKPYPRLYFEMMNAHMVYLSNNSGEYEKVIKASYSRVFGRQPTNEELNYWKSQSKCSFIWLFRAHAKYAETQRRTNAASLSGVKFVTVTPAILAEVRAAAASMVAAGGGN